jgi:hypothetical protein
MAELLCLGESTGINRIGNILRKDTGSIAGNIFQFVKLYSKPASDFANSGIEFGTSAA